MKKTPGSKLNLIVSLIIAFLALIFFSIKFNRPVTLLPESSLPESSLAESSKSKLNPPMPAATINNAINKSTPDLSGSSQFSQTLPSSQTLHSSPTRPQADSETPKLNTALESTLPKIDSPANNSLPPDLIRQLNSPPQELPADLKAQLEAPPRELPEDIKRSMKIPARTVSSEEVNNPNYRPPAPITAPDVADGK